MTNQQTQGLAGNYHVRNRESRKMVNRDDGKGQRAGRPPSEGARQKGGWKLAHCNTLPRH